jgi:hypothetical protein
MTTNSNTQQLIFAARALAERQRADFDLHVAVVAADQDRDRASQEISEADFGIATAQAALAAAQAHKLVVQRRLSSAQLHVQQLAQPLTEARRKLWSICSSPDEQLIVAAAQFYGSVVHDFFLANEESKRLRADLDDTEARITRASDDLEVCTTARRLALESLAAAEQARTAGDLVRETEALFVLEQAVVDAACALTGTSCETYAFSFVETCDLSVWKELEAASTSLP